MWQETKHGLYKQFSFHSFGEAWNFMERVAGAVRHMEHYPRIQIDRGTVDIWLSTHESGVIVGDLDHELANTIDTLILAGNNNNDANTDVQKTMIITEVNLYADGGSRGNPGPSASGYALLDMEGRIVLKQGEYLGVTTNNQAEYQALKLGLERALHDYHAREVHVYMDSMLVVNQMRGIFKIKNRDLWPIHNACAELARKFHKISFDHVPRELNKLADAEVNKALDETLAAAQAAVGE